MGDAGSPHAELEQLRRAMETRSVIDQAHGVLMAAYRCTPPTAWELLVTVSQHTNVKLHKVASALVMSTQGEPLPEPLSSALRNALRSAALPPPKAAPRRDASPRDGAP
ncbi:ANTAR domain-containing protein [Streptomyces sp. WMMB 714]|jgi:hypothetical protein|uniref:ANTAR domain-containing protein n=1 Tax=Streptomyces sp. WMMB 714 TaxID=1286822 RepID=UPI0006982170|nr:ANTAR domain-containing protein [Streptomyces sp. WMMB 714]SCK57967.1 ANTAR domain-containing protein [Streptomyces sp. WMMB 714]